MKSLQTIQKTCKVFQTLTKIAMILCFVGSGLLLLGLICGIVISSTGAVIAGNIETLYRLTSSASFFEMVGSLLAEFVLTLTDALLFFHAWKYFSAEQADGTPFSHKGADLMKRLGILLIVLPAVSAILAGILCGIFQLTQNVEIDLSNGTSLLMGLMLILVSVILHYGAELEENRDAR